MGRGIFDIFCMFVFLAGTSNGSSNSVLNWIEMGALGVCGVFFIVTGLVLKKDLAGGDINSSQLKASAVGAGLSAGLV